MRKFAGIPAALLAFAAITYAQHPVAQERSRDAFRSTVSMVALNVTVTDGRDLVTGLEAADFEVYEDGVQQHVRFFESTAVPLDVILLLDTSSSMRDRMPVVHDAARDFMKVLRPQDRGAVVAFNDTVRVLEPLTSDAAAVEAAIGSAVAHGSTALHTAIYVALKEFGRGARWSGEVRRQAIAVLSDGEDTASLIAFEDVVALARKMGVNIYTIRLQAAGEAARTPPVDDRFTDSAYAMTTLARETGARAFFPGNVHELKHVYDMIAEELESQYSIAYAPTNTQLDGQFRRVSVRVTASPSFRPRARTGYTATPASASVAHQPDSLR